MSLAHCLGLHRCETWREAQRLANDFLARLRQAEGFSERFIAYVDAIGRHLDELATKIGRLY